ncbi:hypothetical protein GGR53DRAFT_491695 [Hypoxylon sp. FL1150]|nr:hypothetical protein GGR53DRAFT_491695 [Hypoxylon sp. FL1150]
MPRHRMPLFNPYEVLGVDPEADATTIKKAYHKLCLQYHPDKAGEDSHETFVKIQESYELLFDSELRALYDNPRSKSKKPRHKREPRTKPSANPDSTRDKPADEFDDDEDEGEEWHEGYGAEEENGRDETPKSRRTQDWYVKGSQLPPSKKKDVAFRGRPFAAKTVGQTTKILNNLDQKFQDLYKRVEKHANKSEKIWEPLRRISRDIAENKTSLAATAEKVKSVVKGQWKNQPDVLDILDVLYKVTERVDVMKRKLLVLYTHQGEVEVRSLGPTPLFELLL